MHQAREHDKEAGLLRSRGYSASGVVLSTTNRNTREKERFYEIHVSGQDVVENWGQCGTQVSVRF